MKSTVEQSRRHSEERARGVVGLTRSLRLQVEPAGEIAADDEGVGDERQRDDQQPTSCEAQLAKVAEKADLPDDHERGVGRRVFRGRKGRIREIRFVAELLVEEKSGEGGGHRDGDEDGVDQSVV